jgi:hypothetical protein
MRVFPGKESYMATRSTDPKQILESRARSLFTIHRIAMVVMWLTAIVAMVGMFLNGVRSTGQYGAARYVLQVIYVMALLWYLIRTGPLLSRLPELSPPILPRWKYSAWIPVLGIALLFAMMVISDDGFNILILLLIIAMVWILLAWRREIHLNMLVQGLAVALIAYFAGLFVVSNGLISKRLLYLLAGLSFPMYVAGSLLFQRTRLGGIQLLAARYGEVLKSVLWGGLLFVPLGLFNAAGGSTDLDVSWVTKWWMPLWIPWFSGIAEEVWFRLFLVGLSFFFLRPAFRTRPALAVIAAITFSGITFGLGHGRTPERFLTTGLLYGMPMAAIYARRDWEHAVGAHYMVNVIPWMMVFLESL